MYFISFCLFSHLGVNNIQATSVFNKNGLHKCTVIGDKQRKKKKESGHFEQYTSSKNAV